jgi:hypothetical protein
MIELAEKRTRLSSFQLRWLLVVSVWRWLVIWCWLVNEFARVNGFSGLKERVCLQ